MCSTCLNTDHSMEIQTVMTGGQKFPQQKKNFHQKTPVCQNRNMPWQHGHFDRIFLEKVSQPRMGFQVNTNQEKEASRKVDWLVILWMWETKVKAWSKSGRRELEFEFHTSQLGSLAIMQDRSGFPEPLLLTHRMVSSTIKRSAYQRDHTSIA